MIHKYSTGHVNLETQLSLIPIPNKIPTEKKHLATCLRESQVTWVYPKYLVSQFPQNRLGLVGERHHFPGFLVKMTDLLTPGKPCFQYGFELHK